ncbi:hypothetical protein [Methylobacterium soli]|uniref:Uncharacterized protein n=1 Tax=Methylobacterium soli TaxID=553447 RepID=A0A6L3SZD4_9HYPH|nr:hypothetical protein [Methylobacterium soli]KAB1079414.1 hypothetical protein F6X53_11465 [Methylobacterium soli]GJE45371.1 hypothetical protein AEGHOMDF_4565 [Methylobacterium soli]
MTPAETQEAVSLIASICTRLRGLPPTATGTAGADLRRLTGAVTTEAESLLRSATLSARMLACFQAAFAAGATFTGFLSLRNQIAALDLVGASARLVRQDASRRCLIQMARCVAATDFKTSDAVLAAQAQINAVFGAAEDETMDALDSDTYRVLVTLHAAVTRDLTTRARPLPRIVTYATAKPMPALALAQRLYGDAGRADDLVVGNDAWSPLFMPASGQALSA